MGTDMGLGFKKFQWKLDRKKEESPTFYSLPRVIRRDAFSILMYTPPYEAGRTLGQFEMEVFWKSFNWTRTPQGHKFWSSIANGFPLTQEHADILNSWREQWV